MRANIEAIEVTNTLRALSRVTGKREFLDPADQAAVAQWSGWGGLGAVFDERRPEWADERTDLHQILSDEDYAAARAGILNAHYTHPGYVRAIWDALGELGATEGQALEPGCGSGTFIGMAPEGMVMTGVELDGVTARVASALYPSAHIRNEGYETTPTTGYFDVAVGNVPFGDIRLYDPANNPGRHSIHNHFIIKALAQTKPGGLVAVLTSHHTLDAKNPAARRDMQEKADLLGAIRLPSGAHKRMANTEVVTDLLLFRVRKDDEKPQPFDWEHSLMTTVEGTDEQVPVNRYIREHPNHVLGTMRGEVGMYGAFGLTVQGPEGDELIPALNDALASVIAVAKYRNLTFDPADVEDRRIAVAPSNTRQLGHIRPTRDEAGRRTGFEQLRESGYEPLAVPTSKIKGKGYSQADELEVLLDLRDRTRALLEAESSTQTDSPDIEAQRSDLAAAYEAYRDKFGPLNRRNISATTRQVPVKDEFGEQVLDEDGLPVTEDRETLTVRLDPVMYKFRGDPFSALTRAIEHYDEETEVARPAPLLKSRQVFAHYEPKGADTPAEALSISMGQKGRVDLDYCADLLGMNRGETREALGELVYNDPEKDLELVPAAEYLSGNVRRKLAAVRAYRTTEDGEVSHDHLAVNERALLAVQPTDLTMVDVVPELGAPWIPVEDHRDFLDHLISSDELTYNPSEGWKCKSSWGSHTARFTTWGTERMGADAILQAMLNHSPIEVRDPDPNNGPNEHRTIVNFTETEAARGQGERIREEFQRWIWTDSERAKRLLADYNERFNALVPRKYDEAGAGLRLPGLAQTFDLHSHQKTAIARMIAEPTTGLFHEVGAGKTLEMVCGTMEQKRLGLINKPMVVVPNHMLYQFEREWLQAYPQARILTADTQSMNAQNRAEFLARAATGDWDAIITTQSAFGSIAVSQDTKDAYKDHELEMLEEWIAGSEDQMSVKAAERRRQSLIQDQRAREAKRLAKEDPGITFEQVGVDYLVVDEAHHFKNLSAPTKLRGVISTGSPRRAEDLDMKIDYLRRTHGPRVLTMATATPIANTMGEMWVMTHYLRPDVLEDAKLRTFDDWANTFCAVQQKVESTANGSLKVKQRISKFQNLPELLSMWTTFADVKTRDQLDLKLPSLNPNAEGERIPKVTAVDIGAAMDQFNATLTDRAEALERGLADPTQDNFLTLSSDGRAFAQDYRLLRGKAATRSLEKVDTADIHTQKIDVVADEVARIYEETKDQTYVDDEGAPAQTPGALQLVFCDLGTPKPDRFNLYDELKAQLIERGVPAERIVFTHEAKNSVEKDRIFARARTGAINVLIGSTSHMGTGANIQARAIALHHVDAPWRPADISQREGRIIRQGNQNESIDIYRYVTEESYDQYMWQTLERKAAFIAPIMTNAFQGREVEDIGDEEAGYAQVKAIASGNPLLMKEAEYLNDVTNLRARTRTFQQQQVNLESDERHLGAAIAVRLDKAGRRDLLAQSVRPTTGEGFHMTVNGPGMATPLATDDRGTAALELDHALRLLPYNTAQNHAHAVNWDYPRGIADIRINLGGHEWRLGVAPRKDEDRAPRFTLGLASLIDAEKDYRQDGGIASFTREELTDKGVGIIRRMENHVNGLGQAADNHRAVAAQLQGELEEVRAQMGATDPWAPKLKEAEARLNALREEMARTSEGQDTLPDNAGVPVTATQAPVIRRVTMDEGNIPVALKATGIREDGVPIASARAFEEFANDCWAFDHHGTYPENIHVQDGALHWDMDGEHHTVSPEPGGGYAIEGLPWASTGSDASATRVRDTLAASFPDTAAQVGGEFENRQANHVGGHSAKAQTRGRTM